MALLRDHRQLPTQRADPGRGFVRIDFTDHPQHLGVTLRQHTGEIERLGPGQQLVQQHTEAVDVGAGVDVEPGHLGLFGRHVLGRPDHLPKLGEQGLLGQFGRRRLGDSEVDHLRHRDPVVQRHQDVRRFQVPMDHTFLVRVLHRVTHLSEQLEPLGRVEFGPITEVRDRHAPDQLHHEVRTSAGSRSAIEDLGDVRVDHQRERLPLGLEPRHDLARVHPELDDLQRDLATDRFLLLGHPHRAEATFPDLLEQLEASDDRTRSLLASRSVGGRIDQEAVRTIERCEQRVDSVAELIRRRGTPRGPPPPVRGPGRTVVWRVADRGAWRFALTSYPAQGVTPLHLRQCWNGPATNLRGPEEISNRVTGRRADSTHGEPQPAPRRPKRHSRTRWRPHEPARLDAEFPP